MPPAPIPENEAARLATLHAYAILDTPPEQVYDDMTQLAGVMCETPISQISLIDQDRQWFKSSFGSCDTQTSRDKSICAYTLADAKPLVVEDTLLDPRFLDNPLVTGKPGIRFYAGVPLVAPNGHVLGTICIIDLKPRTLAPEKLNALRLLSAQIITHLEARLARTESQRAAAALISSEKLAAVGRLAASMAHEIKNPLETVSNLIYLARQHVRDPEVQDWLDRADVELNRITAVTNQSLLFSQQPAAPRSVTCFDLVSPTLGIYEGRLKQAGITVEKCRRTTETVTCFESDIRQALGHLIANAIDAMPAGGRLLIRSRVATQWKGHRKRSEQAKGLVITIADTGTGIAPNLRKKIFEPFFTTKGSAGSGLGLWISADILRRHHGYLSIRSSRHPAHHGTVVSLFLPFHQSPQPLIIPVEDAMLQAALYGDVLA